MALIATTVVGLNHRSWSCSTASIETKQQITNSIETHISKLISLSFQHFPELWRNVPLHTYSPESPLIKLLNNCFKRLTTLQLQCFSSDESLLLRIWNWWRTKGLNDATSFCMCFCFDNDEHHWKRHRNSNYVRFYFSSWFLFHIAIPRIFHKIPKRQTSYCTKTHYHWMKQHENCKLSKTIDSVYGFNWNMWNVKQNWFANDIDCILFSLFIHPCYYDINSSTFYVYKL